MKKKTTLKGFLLNLLAVMISLLIAFLIGEFVIRILYKDQIVLFPRYHTDMTYGDYTIRGVRPDMEYYHRSIDGDFRFVSNNHGFRNTEDIDYVKPAGEVRVLSLGDSHTLGYEVNQGETFSAIAEAKMVKDGLKAKVINAGVSGFSTAEALVFLQNEGYQYQPDFVVLGFFDNDFIDNIRAGLYSVKNDALQVSSHQYIPGVKVQNLIYSVGLFRYLGENSYLYAFAFNATWGFFKELSVKDADKEVEYAITTDTDFSNQETLLMKKLIERMFVFCKSINAKLIVCDIPTTEMHSSIPDDMVGMVRANSDTLFYALDLLDEYAVLGSTHVAHGHRHISKESHHLLGIKIAQYIENQQSQALINRNTINP